MVLLERDHYGSGRQTTIAAAATETLWARRNRVATVITTGAGGKCKLPDARKMPSEGFPAFFVLNDDTSTDAFDLQDNAGGALRTIPVGKIVMVSLEDKSTQAGEWGVSQPRDFSASATIE